MEKTRSLRAVAGKARWRSWVGPRSQPRKALGRSVKPDGDPCGDCVASLGAVVGTGNYDFFFFARPNRVPRQLGTKRIYTYLLGPSAGAGEDLLESAACCKASRGSLSTPPPSTGDGGDILVPSFSSVAAASTVPGETWAAWSSRKRQLNPDQLGNLSRGPSAWRTV